MQFIENNPEQIILDTIKRYEQLAGYSLNPADIERLIIDVMAYRECIIRSQMERIIQQNFVQTADGFSLDYWGELFGVGRIEKEKDDAYRKRILTNATSTALGTRESYINKIKTSKHIADVLLLSKQDETTLPPGVIKLVLIQKQTDNKNIGSGKIADENVKGDILNLLSDKNQNIVGDMFFFEDATPVPINGTIELSKKVGITTEEALTDINYQVDRYFGNLSLKFNGFFGIYDLERDLILATSIGKINNLIFNNVPILRQKQFYVKGNINTIFL